MKPSFVIPCYRSEKTKEGVVVETGPVAALVDLLLLSRCQRIFGSYWSSFSGVAAKLGKVPLEIVMKD